MPGTTTLTPEMTDEEIRRATKRADEIVVEGDPAFRRRIAGLFGIPAADVEHQQPNLNMSPMAAIPPGVPDHRPGFGDASLPPSPGIPKGFDFLAALDEPDRTPKRQPLGADPPPGMGPPPHPAGSGAPRAPDAPSPLLARPAPGDLPPELMFRPPAAAVPPEPSTAVPWGGSASDEEVGHFGHRPAEGLFAVGEVSSGPRSTGGGGSLWLVVGVLVAVVAAAVFFFRSGHTPPPPEPAATVQPASPPGISGHSQTPPDRGSSLISPPPSPPIATQPAQPPPIQLPTQSAAPTQSDAAVELAKTLAWPVVVVIVALIVLFAVVRALGTGHSVEVKWRVAKVGEGSMVLKKTVTRMPKRAMA